MLSLEYIYDILEIYRFDSSRNDLFLYKTYKYKNKLNYSTPNNSPLIYKINIKLKKNSSSFF